MSHNISHQPKKNKVRIVSQSYAYNEHLLTKGWNDRFLRRNHLAPDRQIVDRPFSLCDVHSRFRLAYNIFRLAYNIQWNLNGCLSSTTIALGVYILKTKQTRLLIRLLTLDRAVKVGDSQRASFLVKIGG